MIQIDQLRIGSLVYDINSSPEYIVFAITPTNKVWAYQKHIGLREDKLGQKEIDIEDLLSVKLDPENLEDLQWKRGIMFNNTFYHDEIDEVRIKMDQQQNHCKFYLIAHDFYDLDDPNLKEVKWVHELQNIMVALKSNY